MAGVREAFDRWTEAYNCGDIETYVSAYAENARYVTANGILQGRPAIEAYIRRNGGLHGTLSIESFQIDWSDDTNALVFGRFSLEVDSSTGGCFTVHVVRESQEWKIQSDHSSALPEQS